MAEPKKSDPPRNTGVPESARMHVPTVLDWILELCAGRFFGEVTIKFSDGYIVKVEEGKSHFFRDPNAPR